MVQVNWKRMILFNPGIALNKQNASKETFLIGAGGSTDLINAVELAAQYDNSKRKEIYIYYFSTVVYESWINKSKL